MRGSNGRLRVVLDVPANFAGALDRVEACDEVECHVDSGRDTGGRDHRARVDEAFVRQHFHVLVAAQVMTSAGTAAGIDLCLHLVALDHGVDVAATVARRLVMPLFRAGGQAQYLETPVAADSGGLSALLDWGRANLDAGITVDELATRGAMSPRTLTRRFRAAVGMPPGEWLQRERLRLAQRLLERTEEPVEAVARRAGYESSVTMRAQFAARLDTSPRAYRQTFRGRPRLA